MKVVLDTNILVSALNFPGNERRVLDLAQEGAYDLYLSVFILQEVSSVLVRKFRWSEERAAQAIGLLRSIAVIVQPQQSLSVVQRNDADNRILECAVEASSDYVVTGDRRHLLPIQRYEGIRIVTSVEFLAILEQG